MEDGKKVIFFDGVCNLCNSTVQYIIKHDKKDCFRFATLQGEFGQKFIAERNIDTSKVDSIILVEPNIAYYTKAAAALKIGRSFGGLWQLLWIFEQLPNWFNNMFYDYIARNRYRWYGKKDACMIPTPELKAKFLD